MYKVVNKSRQMIPVMVMQSGELVTKHLLSCGEAAECQSEEITSNMEQLSKEALIRIDTVPDKR